MMTLKRWVLLLSTGLLAGSQAVAAEPSRGSSLSEIVAGKSGKAKEDAEAPADGQVVRFGDENYFLKENLTMPTKNVRELREYLRKGEDWDDYSKMVALREMQGIDADAATFAKEAFNVMLEKYPKSRKQDIIATPERAVTIVTLISGNIKEYSLWEYRKTKAGFYSVQFVYRNKEPYETEAKFRAEREENEEAWQDEVKKLASQTKALIKASAK